MLINNCFGPPFASSVRENYVPPLVIVTMLTMNSTMLRRVLLAPKSQTLKLRFRNDFKERCTIWVKVQTGRNTDVGVVLEIWAPCRNPKEGGTRMKRTLKGTLI